MSFLLLKAPDCDPRKEVIGATHEGVFGQESFKVLEGGSFWSISGQTHEPLWSLDGGRRNGQSVLNGYTSGLKELKADVFDFENEKQQDKKESGSGQARTEHACGEEQQVSKESFEDGVVCKLVSPSVLPEFSTSCPHELEREFKELKLQDTKLDTSVSCLEQDSLKWESPPASFKGPAYGQNSEGLLLSPDLGEVNVGPIKLRSALRGGYEKAGFGPRSQVHVSWGPYVYDPPCTSTSHTSSQNHRRHRHPRSELKNRHKGKGSSQSDSHKKSKKKMARKSKHTGENFISGPTVVSQRGIQNNTLMLKEYVAPLEDLMWKGAKVSPFILPPKSCFLNPVLSFSDRDLVTVEKIQGCHPRHVQTHKLCL